MRGDKEVRVGGWGGDSRGGWAGEAGCRKGGGKRGEGMGGRTAKRKVKGRERRAGERRKAKEGEDRGKRDGEEGREWGRGGEKGNSGTVDDEGSGTWVPVKRGGSRDPGNRQDTGNHDAKPPAYGLPTALGGKAAGQHEGSTRRSHKSERTPWLNRGGGGS